MGKISRVYRRDPQFGEISRVDRKVLQCVGNPRVYRRDPQCV